MAHAEAARQLADLDAAGEELEPQEKARTIAAIKRRLLHAADDRPVAVRTGLGLSLGAVMVAVFLGLAGYRLLGTPDLADRRIDKPQDPALEARLAELETLLAQNPTRADGWALLGRSAANLRQFKRAADAYGQAAQADPDNPDYWIAYGEMLMEVASGLVTPASILAFDRAERLVPDHPAIAYYKGLGQLQKGQDGEAVALWTAALDRLPDGAPERLLFESALQQAEQRRQSQEIAALPPDEQRAFIESMVTNLAARLEEAPDDPDGWLRLARAYEVLEQTEQALAAYRRVLPLLDDNRTQFVENRMKALANTIVKE